MKRRATTTRSHAALRHRKPSPGRKRRVAIKQRIRAAQPLHVRFALHPISILLLLIAGVLMAGWTWHARADTYSVTGKVPAPPLIEGAVITSPTDGTATTAASTVVSGTCPDASYVKLTRNSVFSGVSACAANNTFTISTALSPGANTLVAQDYNITDDPGPTTPGITVTYRPPQPQGGGGTSNSGSSGSPSSSGGSTAAAPLLIVSDYHFQAIASGAAYHWIITLNGGTAPYTLVVDWGDGGETIQTADSPGNVTISHSYTSPGYFTIIINATDAGGATSTLQLVAFVRVAGTGGVLFQSGNNSTPSSTGNILFDTLTASKWLLVAWPSYVVVSLMVASFWLGERQEIRQLFARQKLPTHRHS